jgi:chemotaxis protein CheD
MAVIISDAVKVEKESIVIGMGEMAVSNSPGVVLTCIGLGSCIALCAYDKVVKTGGMIHIVLPQHHGDTIDDLAKFADTGVPLLINEIIRQGGDKRHLAVKIAGGAQMTIAPGLKDTFKTGERNLVQVLTTLEQLGLGLKAAEVGGNLGRTAKLYIDTGIFTVKTVNGAVKEI